MKVKISKYRNLKDPQPLIVDVASNAGQTSWRWDAGAIPQLRDKLRER